MKNDKQINIVRKYKIESIEEEIRSHVRGIRANEQNIDELKIQIEIKEGILKVLKAPLYRGKDNIYISTEDIDLIIRAINVLYEELNHYDVINDKELFEGVQEEITILADKLILYNKINSKER